MYVVQLLIDGLNPQTKEWIYSKPEDQRNTPTLVKAVAQSFERVFRTQMQQQNEKVNAIQTEINTDRLRLLEQKLEETQKELEKTKQLLKTQNKNPPYNKRRQPQQENLLDRIPLQRGYAPHQQEHHLDTIQHFYPTQNHFQPPIQHHFQTPYSPFPQHQRNPYQPPCAYCGGLDHYSPNNRNCTANKSAPYQGIHPQRGTTMNNPRGNNYRGRGSGRPPGRKGQPPPQSPTNQLDQNQDSQKLLCYKCGGEGHWANQCASPEPPPNQNKNLYE